MKNIPCTYEKDDSCSQFASVISIKRLAGGHFVSLAAQYAT